MGILYKQTFAKQQFAADMGRGNKNECCLRVVAWNDQKMLKMAICKMIQCIHREMMPMVACERHASYGSVLN